MESDNTNDIILTTIRYFGPSTLQYVRNPTAEMCLVAAGINSFYMPIIEHPTPPRMPRNIELFPSVELECPCCFDLCTTMTACHHQLCRSCSDRTERPECPLCRCPLFVVPRSG